jgi:predicted Zn-dependent peptidase
MKEYQRKQLLERIDREGATIGVQIPETIEVQGEEIALQSFVFEIKRRDTYPSGERERVETAKKNLRRERLQRRQRIENDEVSFEEGERLADSIIGISRALEALQQLESPDIEQEAQAQEAADRKRWMSFLKQALGREDANSTRRGV